MITYEELEDTTDEMKARQAFNRRYVEAGLDHMTTFERFYMVVWPETKHWEDEK